MYNSIANNNPLLNSFSSYANKNPTSVPFNSNDLIKNNVNIMNNLNNYIYESKMIDSPQNNNNIYNNNNNTNKNANRQKTSVTNMNIIEKMLEPVKIIKDKKSNSDIKSNFITRSKIQESAKNTKGCKSGIIGIERTNAPYKAIIKDKIISKPVTEVVEEDLIVHRTVKGIDDNVDNFVHDLNSKNSEVDKINDELKVEFDISNYDKHKRKFEYKQTFVRNLAYEENGFDENKTDCIEFYKKKQRDAEKGIETCDTIYKTLLDANIIDENELIGDSIVSDTNININSIIDKAVTKEINDNIITENINNNVDEITDDVPVNIMNNRLDRNKQAITKKMEAIRARK